MHRHKFRAVSTAFPPHSLPYATPQPHLPTRSPPPFPPVVWWIFLLAFNSMPLSISLDLYWLFLGVVASNPQYWLYVLLVPVACILPDFFFRSVRR